MKLTLKLIGGLLLILLVGIVLIFVFFPGSRLPFANIICKVRGGTMTNYSLSVFVQNQQCIIPVKDEGKSCYQNSDCQVHCIAVGQTDSQGYQLGKCGRYSEYVCDPFIPVKTKSAKDFKGFGCV